MCSADSRELPLMEVPSRSRRDKDDSKMFRQWHRLVDSGLGLDHSVMLGFRRLQVPRSHFLCQM